MPKGVSTYHRPILVKCKSGKLEKRKGSEISGKKKRILGKYNVNVSIRRKGK
jgi:hypothetical protein